MIASLDKQSAPDEPPSLYAMLAVGARKASDVTLAGLAAVGGVTAVALIAVRPHWWTYALLPIVAGSFGLWGILEREISERGANRSARYDRIITAIQWLAVVIGTLAAIVTAFAVLGILLGTIIS